MAQMPWHNVPVTVSRSEWMMIRACLLCCEHGYPVCWLNSAHYDWF